MTAVVPYSFNGITEYSRSQGGVLPDQAQGVYITLSTDYQFILNKIVGWFSDRDEVELIDHGLSDKQAWGYIILEWLRFVCSKTVKTGEEQQQDTSC